MGTGLCELGAGSEEPAAGVKLCSGREGAPGSIQTQTPHVCFAT